MSFRPTIRTAFTLQNMVFHVVEHPSAKGIPYGQTGRRAIVYCVENEAQQRYALKVFNHAYRTHQIERSSGYLAQFARLPGLSVCARIVLTPQNDPAILVQYPDLAYAVLMPWIDGQTWQERLLSRQNLLARQSYTLAVSLAQILAALEAQGAAHCDISGANVILANDLASTALVDVEEMYAPGFEQPSRLPAGSLGYNHKVAASGLWNPYADRFAGTVLLAEILAWCDSKVCQIANGEQIFAYEDMQRATPRVKEFGASLQTLWGEAVHSLFSRAWKSEKLEDCPSFAEWSSILAGLAQRISTAEEASTNIPTGTGPVRRWRTIGSEKVGQQPPEIQGLLKVGQILNARYQIQEPLGEGGFSTVYLALDLQTKTQCVVKSNRYLDENSRRQLMNEAQILRRLSHPNLAKVLDFFEISDQGQYLVMEFIAGNDLQTILERQRGPLPQEQVLAWVATICDVLDYIHSQNIVHRDIKPANLRITADGRPILVDFGIAKVDSPGVRTSLVARAVSPGYSPTEQYGNTSTNSRSDIYALGATGYALLTGKEPPESVLRSTGKPLEAPGSINASVTRGVEQAILRAMSLHPDQRFKAAREFKAALYTQPVEVPPNIFHPQVSFEGPLPPPLSNNQSPKSSSFGFLSTALGAVLAVFFCIAVLGASWWYCRDGACWRLTPQPVTQVPSGTSEVSPTILPETPGGGEPPVIAPPVTVETHPTDLPVDPFAGQRLAYAAGGEQSTKRSIYIKYLDDSRADTRLTSGTDQFGDNFPSFSPDGNSIAFSRCYLKKSDGCDLFVMSLAASNAQQVLTGHKVMRPKWCTSASSSYRDWVVFEDRRKNGNNYQDTASSLALVNATTGEFKQLTTSLSDWFPNWSPDCSKIVFTRYDDNDTKGLYADLMLLDLNTDNVSLLIGSGSFSPPAELSPTWSPDNEWIAYRKAADTNGDGIYRGADDRNDLWLVHPDGSGEHAVIANSYSVSSISWSPDSQILAFTTQDNHLFISNLQGEIIGPDFGGDYFHPDWAP